jgi:hypothetical protein
MTYEIVSRFVTSKLNHNKRYANCINDVEQTGDTMFKFYVDTGIPMKHHFGRASGCVATYDEKIGKVRGRFKVCNRNEVVECVKSVISNYRSSGVFK